jgi:succinate dehydrogenase/fumarate reductase flavoprotein subunit
MIELTCDVLVVGGGAAGSRAALEAKRTGKDLSVLIAVAGKNGLSGSSGLIASESLGINAPFNFAGDGDNPDVYFEDMVETGGGLGDPKLFRIIADESRARVEDLMSLGLHFDSEGGLPIQRKLSGCTKARSLTCGGSTGLRILTVLKQANIQAGVQVVEDIRLFDLLLDDCGRVCGAVGQIGQEQAVIHARAVVLATGGAGRLFRKNVNPPTLDGDGWAMAYRAGARFVNMEFFQIGPGVVNPHMDFIIHSHLWRLKPRLTNINGQEFIERYCPPGISVDDVIDLKAMSYPFSVRTIAKYLDIAIFKEIMEGRGTPNDGVYFDVTHIGEEELLERCPITYKTIRKAGSDLAKASIELGLVVQNFNGGVLIDEKGFTGVDGLFAAGEVTGGVHGSDRPGGNNLIDTQVFGCRAGRFAAAHALESAGNALGKSHPSAQIVQNAVLENQAIAMEAASADLYYRNLTVVRTADGLNEVLNFIQKNKSIACTYSSLNRLLVGQLLAVAALTRKESRGTHYREDFPATNPEATGRIVIRQGSDGEPVVTIAG